MNEPLRSRIDQLTNETISLPRQDPWPQAQHRFTKASLWALDMAIETGRPLLIRGEPGIGKSQIARAAAEVLKVPFLSFVVNERTERDDLLFHYDAVARLAAIQVPRPKASGRSDSATDGLPESLQESSFIRPGVLWWALNWDTAKVQANLFTTHCRPCPEPCPQPATRARVKPLCGPVVLIDEIDKADPSVPNGLLECLGTDGFRSPQLVQSVSLPESGLRPLIILTTNEERELPPAFLRRCLVITIAFPKSDDEATRFLKEERVRPRFNEAHISDDVCNRVIAELLAERAIAQQGQVDGVYGPGAAEFLDIVSALVTIGATVPAKKRTAEQLHALNEIQRFALVKTLQD
jgi:MoxR-like ATPase